MMMRTILLIVTCLLIVCYAIGQTKPDSDKLMAEIARLYNKAAYKELYMLCAADFKAQIPEHELSAFYADNLRVPLGKIVKWSAQPNADEAKNYTVKFEKGKLDVSIYVNGNNEIAGIQWLPSKSDDTKPKKKTTAAVSTNNPKETNLQLLIDSVAKVYLQNAATCGMSIGVINGDRTETYFYGSTDKESGKLPDASTIYEIGSVTKTFTGILLAHAINEGRIKADDDIRKYLPGNYPALEYKGKPIKMQDLSNHTSGLPRLPNDLDKQPHFDMNDPYKSYTEEMMYGYLSKIKLNKEPGVTAEYSNLGVALLAIIIKNVYQQPLDSLVKKYITEPAGMSHTRFYITAEERERMATGYSDETGKSTAYWNLEAFNGCGGLKSDLTDMIKYAAANMNEINVDFKLSHEQTYKDARTATGLNWMLTPFKNDNTLIWHNGGTAGFSSFCGYIKGRKIGVVILSNTGIVADNVAIGILTELLKG